MLAAQTGLEIVGYILRPADAVKEGITRYWRGYFALVGVAEENVRLRAELRMAEEYLAGLREDRAELLRLREFFQFRAPADWSAVGASVLAGRFGPMAALETVVLDRGFATGARPGTPLVTHQGVVGAVFRASPHTSTALLLTDPGFRVAVIGQESRVPGLLAGTGPRSPLELRYVPQSAQLKLGELVVTSGLDSAFPKGIPVGKVLSVQPADITLFLHVQVAPVVSLEEVEQVLLLVAPENRIMEDMPDVSPESGRDAFRPRGAWMRRELP